MYRGVYSEFEVKEQYIKIAGDEGYTSMSCVGTSEEELEVKVITKNCRGVRQREKVKGTGNGTLTQKLHVPREVYNKMYAMSRETLKAGIYAYGQGSSHPEFSLTQKVLDEDDVIKFKAYPRCVLESGPKRPIENGQTEVPELDMTITILPDDYGECMYEALQDDLQDEELSTNWLTAFEPSMAYTSSAASDSEEESTEGGEG